MRAVVVVVALAVVLGVGVVVFTRDTGPRLASEEAADYVDALERWEGLTDYLYLDVKGLPTCGMGHLCKTERDALGLPWEVDGRPATAAEVRAQFAAVAAAPVRLNTDGQNTCGASFYEGFSTMRLPGGYARQLAAQRLEQEFLPALRADFPGFDAFPPSAREALVDMAYNLGAHALPVKFPTLTRAVNAGDFAAAARASHRRAPTREERNVYVADLLMSAANQRRVT